VLIVLSPTLKVDDLSRQDFNAGRRRRTAKCQRGGNDEHRKQCRDDPPMTST
jgi:hypothetical protein